MATTLDRSATDQQQTLATLREEVAVSPYAAIAEYAFVSDRHTGALIAPDGSVDWLCVPAFDSPSIFASLLDRQAGSFRFGPYGIVHPNARRYLPGTNAMETTWHTRTGWLVVHDALVMGPAGPEDTVTRHTRPPAGADARHMLVRTVECTAGHAEVEMVCEPIFDYGRTPADWSLRDDQRHSADASGAGVSVRLRSDMSIGIEAGRARGRRILRAGERAYCTLSWADQLTTPATFDEAKTMIDETADFWRMWLENSRMPDHRWREYLQRSALAIKGLSYMPTGATLAALTTSLPETPGGERNWDYRYTWMRDSTFTLRALHFLLLDWEADEFMHFVADVEPSEDGSLQIMYGIDGRRDLTEETRDELSGHDGAHPVRIGNGAYELTGPASVDMTELAAAFSRALNRPVAYVDVPLDQWQAGLSKLGQPPHIEQHIATMAQLHRDNRYNRTADDVERVTGTPPQSIETFVAAHRHLYID